MWIIFLMVLPTLVVAAAGNDACPVVGTPAAEIPFTLIGDHIYVEASVNGTGPYRFIVDTGGVNLIDVELAKQLSLKVTGKETGHGTGPETVETGKTRVGKLGLGNTTFVSQRFYTFDFTQLYAGGGVKMMGMVGAGVLRRYVICIAFQNDKIELFDPARLDLRRAGTSLPIAIKESEITVAGSFDGIPGKFQIDTGSPTTLTLTAPFVAKHRLMERFPRRVETSSGGVGGLSREYVVRGKDLVLGSARITDPITSLANVSRGQLANSDIAGIVGIGALKRYVVTFDFPGKRLFFSPYDPAPAGLDTYDRSGMRIEKEADGFRVAFVAAGTPAAEGGVQRGDVIVAVNSRPASSISLPDLRDELRQSPAGSTVALEIESGGKRRNVVVTLHDLL